MVEMFRRRVTKEITVLHKPQGTTAVWTPPCPASRTHAAIFLSFLAFGAVYIAAVVPRTYPVAPADGLVYADAFDRAMAGRVTVRGDTIGRETLDLVACSPLITGSIRGWMVPAGWDCGSDAEPPKIRSTAWIHAPTSFFLDVAGARLICLLTGMTNAFTAARLLGAVWFALGATMTVMLAEAWGAPPWRAAAVLAAFLPTPLFFSLFTYVTPDRFALAVGALVFLAGTRWWRRQLPAPWLAAVGVISGGLFKQTFIVADMGLVALTAALWWQSATTGTAGRTGRETMLGMTWLLAGSGCGIVGWHLLKLQWGVELPARSGPDLFTIVPSLDGALSILFQHPFLTPMGDTRGFMLEPLTCVGFAALLTLATAGAGFGAVFYRRLADREFPLALAGLVTVGPGGLLISILGGVSSGNWLPASPRYVLAAFPLLVLPLLLLANRRPIWIGSLAMAGLGTLAWAAFPLS